uniref:Uncharacterized protein n=1 Tax=Plectus sambesii TaxID=2011161 RepID=A0A914VMA0_9BILA
MITPMLKFRRRCGAREGDGSEEPAANAAASLGAESESCPLPPLCDPVQRLMTVEVKTEMGRDRLQTAYRFCCFRIAQVWTGPSYARSKLLGPVKSSIHERTGRSRSGPVHRVPKVLGAPSNSVHGPVDRRIYIK